MAVAVGFPTTMEKVVVTDCLAVPLSSARFLNLSFLNSQSAASAGDNMIHPPFSDGYGDLLSTKRVSAGEGASAAAAKAWQTKQTATARMAVHDLLVEGIMSWLQDTGIKASATSPLYNNAEFLKERLGETSPIDWVRQADRRAVDVSTDGYADLERRTGWSSWMALVPTIIS